MTSVLPLISPEKGTQLDSSPRGRCLSSGRLLPRRGAARLDAVHREVLARDVRARGHPSSDPRRRGLTELGDQIGPLVLIGLVWIPLGLWVFSRGEQYAKRDGKSSGRMTEPAVHVDGLLKVFDVPERDEGLKAATKSLVRRKTREVRAVDGISFEIAPGEIVGFLGRTAPARRRRSRCSPACST